MRYAKDPRSQRVSIQLTRLLISSIALVLVFPKHLQSLQYHHPGLRNSTFRLWRSWRECGDDGESMGIREPRAAEMIQG